MQDSIEALPKLSVAIITYNEEKNIQSCLDSVVDFADEIIVLDSFSTDATESICRQIPKVQFSQHPFDGHIEQKNRALQQCRGEWILSIDADERVTPELRHSIENFLASNPQFHGAKFPRLTRHMNRFIRHGGWYPNQRYRLVRKGKAYWGGENPHDKLIIEGKGVRLKGDLLHLTCDSISDQVKTINNFSTIVADTRFKKGKKASILRMVTKPFIKFIEVYLVKRGFLDGANGLVIAAASSYSAFLKEAKLYEHYLR